MIKKFYILFKLFFLKKNRKYKIRDYNFDFQKITLKNTSNFKNIFFSDKYFVNKILHKKNYDYHNFNFLMAAKIMGGAANVKLARKHIINWTNKKYSQNTAIWSINCIAKRLVNLIYIYEFYAISASEKEKREIHFIIIDHYLILKIKIQNIKIEKLNIEEVKAMILASFIYSDEENIFIKKIKKLIINQVDQNGFHKSYNPFTHAFFINQLHELKNIFLFFETKVPNEIDFQIINMSSFLGNLFHKDGSIALFNGSNNCYIEGINQVLMLSKDIKQKKIFNDINGLNIYADKNIKIFMDTAKPLDSLIHKNIHAGTLSFEMSCMNEKIITNCGSSESKKENKIDYLRYSAAHSTITINNTNISELIEKKSYKRTPKIINIKKKEDENNEIWESGHDGYLNNFKKLVRRKLIISKKYPEIIGVDTILNTKFNFKKISYQIRFHLMPGINCLLTNNEKTVLLKTKNNQKWIFQSKSRITIEDSIYMGDGVKINQNKQIIIHGTIKDRNIVENWSLKKS